jgi:nucleoside-diphosphate-sugar epimerase
MTQHVLVTGATGFLGRHLAMFLTSKPGLTVWALSKHGGEVGDLRVASVDLGEPEAVAAWSASVPRFSAIFHLAATVPNTREADGVSLLLRNVKSTTSAVTLAARHQAHFIYASSAFIYDPAGGARLTEESKPRPSTYYHLSKYHGEQVCDLAQRQHGLRTACLRIAAAYGPGQTTRSVIRVFVEAAKRSQDLTVYGSGHRTQDFIHVSDVVKAMWLAWQMQALGTFHVASGQSVSMMDLAETVRANVKDCRSVIRLSGAEDPQDRERWEFSTAEAHRALGFEAAVGLRDGIRSFANDLDHTCRSD